MCTNVMTSDMVMRRSEMQDDRNHSNAEACSSGLRLNCLMISTLTGIDPRVSIVETVGPTVRMYLWSKGRRLRKYEHVRTDRME
jgi:hypothetical protein